MMAIPIRIHSQIGVVFLAILLYGEFVGFTLLLFLDMVTSIMFVCDDAISPSTSLPT